MIYRPYTIADKNILERYVQSDPWHSTEHKEKALPFFLEPVTSLVEDEQGIIFFFKPVPESVCNKLVRVHTYWQFGPPEEVSKKRIAQTLGLFLNRITKLIHELGYKQVVFTSVNKKTIVYVEKYCEFIPSKDEEHVYIHEVI